MRHNILISEVRLFCEKNDVFGKSILRVYNQKEALCSLGGIHSLHLPHGSRPGLWVMVFGVGNGNAGSFRNW